MRKHRANVGGKQVLLLDWEPRREGRAYLEFVQQTHHHSEQYDTAFSQTGIIDT
jgi:hypothetical protein